MGCRCDRFEALKDVFETFRVIMAERKRREMDPTIALLEHCVEEAKSAGPEEDYIREQLEKMLAFTRMVTVFYSHIDRLPPSALQALFKGGATLARLFGKPSTISADATTRDPETVPTGKAD
jgi:DNA-binding transcriptional regulator GbsR (MarR family)